MKSKEYRNDIDGLRAIAVIAVLFFHLGYLPYGYLGVDVFFVISGFLITGIIYQQVLNDDFSIVNFYIKRTRRIIPLVLFMLIISIIIGVIVMLPDDLENLAQSVIATNFFGNNILQAITTKDYWDVVNEYKPLMHTWSLAVEEQYYLVYPFIFLIFRGKRVKYIVPILIVLTIISLILFFLNFDEAQKFYYLPFRFFELSLGGICAILLKGKSINAKYSYISVILLLIILIVDFDISNEIGILISVILTCLILVSTNNKSRITTFLLENKIVIYIGKISFSLYMWHQIIFSYTRYFAVEKISFSLSLFLIAVTFILSALSYSYIEQPFRDRSRMSNKVAFLCIIIGFVLTTSVSFYIYKAAGILKDVPELGLYKKNKIVKGMHSKYNHKNYLLDKNFESQDRIKILVIGDSFARDWINILLESDFKSNIEISYIYDIEIHSDLNIRVKEANVIYCSRVEATILEKYNLPIEKTWCIGPKNFGTNNGVFYNSMQKEYCKQRTSVESHYLDLNKKLKKDWGTHYIDLFSFVIDENNKVPVFTNNCKFISQDCRHLTQSGAMYFSEIISQDHRYIYDFVSLKNKRVKE